MKAQKTKSSPFTKLGLSKELSYTLHKRMGYRIPTPIQRKAIPPILEGSDVIAMAKTGSGKTIAFLAPMVDRLKSHSLLVGVRAIIISPTRELAVQTYTVAKNLINVNNLKLALLIGGSAMHDQFRQLSLNPDVILATPGRLAHHLVEVKEFSLQAVQIIIVDEADRLFELGFLDQLKKIWQSIPPSRQSIFVSATLPAQLIVFSKTGLINPKFIRLDADQTLSDLLTLEFIYIRETDKLSALIRILEKSMHDSENAIVFSATRHHVEYISHVLKEYGFKISHIYGKMDYQSREYYLNEFRKNKTNILIVTDVAARGLDLPEVKRIINYDFPCSNKLFIHRAGRTARAGRTGITTSLVVQNDLPYIIELSTFLNRKILLASQLNNNQPLSIDTSILGGLPNLSHESEFLTNLLKEDSSASSLLKSMTASYNLYYKTRTSPSKSSISKAKTLLEKIGGSSFLTETIHPSYTLSDYNKTITENDQTKLTQLLNDLRGFRPSSTKKGGQISSSISRHLENYKNLKLLPTQILSKENSLNSRLLENSSTTSNQDVVLSPKKFEKKLQKNPQINLSSTPNQFYLDISLAKKRESESHTFALENSKLDLTPDEEGDIRRSKYIKRWRWNPTRKKYEITLVDHHGRIMKDSQGKKIRGDIETKGLYKKWVAQNKIRIQKIGEAENIIPRSKPAIDKIEENSELKSIDMVPEGSDKIASNFSEKKKLLEDEQKKGNLTNKQKRQLKKYKTNNFIKNSEKNELKTAKQISNLRKHKNTLSRKNNSKNSKSNIKKKWENKQQAKISNRARNNRSILIRRNSSKKKN